jgi:hypothetical protein
LLLLQRQLCCFLCQLRFWEESFFVVVQKPWQVEKELLTSTSSQSIIWIVIVIC